MRIFRRTLFFLTLVPFYFVSAFEASKMTNPNKVAPFPDIDVGIYRVLTLENFEEKTITEIFRAQETKAEVILADTMPPPIIDSERYASIRLKDTTERRARLQFLNPPEIHGHCRSLTFWLNVQNPNARLSLLIEDRSHARHFLDSGPLEFRGWRKLTLPLPPNVQQGDLYLGEDFVLRLVAVEVIFWGRYTEENLPVILIDELAAEVRNQYAVPPALQKR